MALHKRDKVDIDFYGKKNVEKFKKIIIYFGIPRSKKNKGELLHLTTHTYYILYIGLFLKKNKSFFEERNIYFEKKHRSDIINFFKISGKVIFKKLKEKEIFGITDFPHIVYFFKDILDNGEKNYSNNVLKDSVFPKEYIIKSHLRRLYDEKRYANENIKNFFKKNPVYRHAITLERKKFIRIIITEKTGKETPEYISIESIL